MKILQYCNAFGKPTLTFVYNQIIGLAAHEGLEILVVTHKRFNEEKFPFDNLKVLQKIDRGLLDSKIRWRLYKYNVSLNYFNVKFSKEVNVIIDEFNPDIIHCHFGDIGLRLYDNLRPGKKKVLPIFFHFHGYDASKMLESSLIYRKRLKKVLAKPNIHPIVVSNDMGKRLIDNHCIGSISRILYYGVDLSAFKRTKLKSDKKTFLQVSSFREKKGHLYTLKAFKDFLTKVENPFSYKLILAGGGEMLEEIKKVALRLGISDQVDFPGWVNHTQAKDLMNKADFFVHHSVTGSTGDQEGIPNSIMEAMAMELPVISTWHSGIPELVEDRVNGYLVEEKDVETYAQRMIDILSWGYMKRNREKVEEKFSKEKHLATLLTYYSEALENRR